MATRKKYYLLSPNGMRVPLAPGHKASVFPEKYYPRIESTDKNGKPCILIDLSIVFGGSEKN